MDVTRNVSISLRYPAHCSTIHYEHFYHYTVSTLYLLSINVQYFGFQMHRLCGECTLRHLRISNLQVNANRSRTVQSRHSDSASFPAEEKFQKPGRRCD